VWIRVGSRLYQNIEFTGACGVKPYLHIERMCQPGKVFHNSVFSQFSHLIVWPSGGGGGTKERDRAEERVANFRYPNRTVISFSTRFTNDRLSVQSG
jgi:hypothetical protein